MDRIRIATPGPTPFNGDEVHDRLCSASDDPDFESKAADIIGLYLNPPQHAAAFYVDAEPRFRRSTGSIGSCPFDGPRQAS
jgi:hypothetical protein